MTDADPSDPPRAPTTPPDACPAPPTVQPVAPGDVPGPRPTRTPAPLLLAAFLLGGIVVAASALAVLRRPATAAPVVSRFGPGTEARVDALVERAATGLLAERTPMGDFTSREGSGVDVAERKEATALGLLGLTIAKRMDPGRIELDAAIASAKRALFTAPPRGAAGNPSRSLKVSAASAGVLSLLWSTDATDAARLGDAVEALRSLTDPGPPVGGWAQGITTKAFAALLEAGKTERLVTTEVPDPRSRVPTWDNLATKRDAGDGRVSEAFASAVKAGGATPAAAAEIFGKVLEDPDEWLGPRTDLARWVLRAWLAGVVPGGDAWFARILPELEKAVGPDGKIDAEIYGYPVSRLTIVLLILWDGARPAATSPSGPPKG